MMGRLLPLALVLALSPLSGCASARDETKKKDLKTFTEKLSYTFGMKLGESFKQMGAEIDVDAFTRGMQDVLAGRTPALTPEQTTELEAEFARQMEGKQRKKMQELATKNKEAGDKFLADNKAKKGVVTTKSGLQYLVIKAGDGPVPKKTDTVRLHYRGTLTDGKEFASSYRRGRPTICPVEGKGIPPGLSEALQLMKVGAQYRVFMPPDLAYGERGVPGIGANSVLIFEVRLLKIEPKDEVKVPVPPKTPKTPEPGK